MSNTPKNHPRYESLMQRELIEKGIHKGVVTLTGMIAQGRGEAFDYLLGEKTTPEAKKQIEIAAITLLLAEKPIITVNGNTTALCKKEIAKLAKAINCEIEINLFYKTPKRIKLIQKEFKEIGLTVLGIKAQKKIPNLTSKRSEVDFEGTWKADVVLVMLEDGDRTEFLRKMGKKVIAIDLNPFSRTAVKANISIIDNVIRAVPLLEKKVKEYSKKDKKWLKNRIKNFSNKDLLRQSESRIRKAR